MVTEELAGTKRLALLGVLTALCVVLRIFKIIPIPNVQPVTAIIMLTTLFVSGGMGFALAILTMIISNIFLGFGIWTIPQILAYGGCVLTILLFKKLTPLTKWFWLQLALVAFLGIEYGILVDLGMTIFGGLPAFIAYWAGSILFDTYHAIGNVVFYLLLYKPISLALKHFFED